MLEKDYVTSRGVFRRSKHIVQVIFKLEKYFMGPFLWIGFICLKVIESLQGDSILFATSPKEFLILNLSTSEGWKAESTFEPPSGLETGTPGLGIHSILTTRPLLHYLTQNMNEEEQWLTLLIKLLLQTMFSRYKYPFKKSTKNSN